MEIKLVPIQTEKDIIRDLVYIMSWVNDPGVNFYFAAMGKKSVADERKFLRAIIRSRIDKVFSVYDGQEYIGQVSINKIDWLAETGRLFLVVTPEKQKKGYARPIVEAILKKAFRKLGLNKIWLITRQENQERIRKWESCGFEQEGVLKEEYKDSRGERHDMVRMAILKKNWEGFRKEDCSMKEKNDKGENVLQESSKDKGKKMDEFGEKPYFHPGGGGYYKNIHYNDAGIRDDNDHNL